MLRRRRAPADPGLLDIAGWEPLSLTRAAQAVQRSAYPAAYATWEALARQIVAHEAGRARTTGR